MNVKSSMEGMEDNACTYAGARIKDAANATKAFNESCKVE